MFVKLQTAEHLARRFFFVAACGFAKSMVLVGPFVLHERLREAASGGWL